MTHVLISSFIISYIGYFCFKMHSLFNCLLFNSLSELNRPRRVYPFPYVILCVDEVVYLSNTV